MAIRGYNIVAELRDTFAAQTFRARDLETLDPVALHVFDRTPISASGLRAVQRRVEACAALRYPTLVRFRKVRADDGVVLVETDFVEGERLDAVLERQGRLEPTRALRIAEDLLMGLVAAEMRGLAHGAVQPSTVILTRECHAVLDGLGFGEFLAEAPPSHDRDVLATTALLYRMVEGHPPPSGPFWGGTVFPCIYDAAAHPGEVPAGKILALVRAAIPRCAEPVRGNPTILDAVEPPPPPPRRERLKDLVRRVATHPNRPIFAAALLGTMVAVLCAAPFLGDEAQSPGTVIHALPLPPTSTARTPLRSERRCDPAPEPVRQTEFERIREEVVALAELGDFKAALEIVAAAKGWTPEQVQEERDATIAKAAARLQETREFARALAGEGRLAEAEKEWDALVSCLPPLMPGEDPKTERIALAALAANSLRRKAERDRERAQRQAEREFSEFARSVLLVENPDYDELIRRVDAHGNAQVLRECLVTERDYFQFVQERIRTWFRRVQIQQISKRFGTGEIAALNPDSIVVTRTRAAPERIPISRFSGPEKYALFIQFRRPPLGSEALAMALMCLRWGIFEQAKTALSVAETLEESPSDRVNLIRQVLREEAP